MFSEIVNVSSTTIYLRVDRHGEQNTDQYTQRDKPRYQPPRVAGRSSVVRAFAHGAMGRRIDPSWSGPIELFLVPASAPLLV